MSAVCSFQTLISRTRRRRFETYGVISSFSVRCQEHGVPENTGKISKLYDTQCVIQYWDYT